MEKRKQPARPHQQPIALEGSILTDLTFQPVAADRGAQALIATWESGNGRPDANRSLPTDLLAALKARPLDDLADVHAHFRIGSIGYICRVSVMTPCFSKDSRPLLALHIQRNPELNEAIRKVAEEFDLTGREYEALQYISAGLTCKEVAEKMNISPNTVKAFLRLIMIKMGVSRRGGILSKVLELTQQGNGNGSSKHD